MPNERRRTRNRTTGCGSGSDHNKQNDQNEHSDRPAQPFANPFAPRQKPNRWPDPQALPALPYDTPPPGHLSVSISLYGPQEQIVALVERLRRDLDVKVYIDAGIPGAHSDE